MQLPFTPGLIPKEKGRLAKSIGQVVVQLELGHIAVENLTKEIKGGLDKSLFGAMAFFINDSLIESIGAS